MYFSIRFDVTSDYDKYMTVIRDTTRALTQAVNTHILKKAALTQLHNRQEHEALQ